MEKFVSPYRNRIAVVAFLIVMLGVDDRVWAHHDQQDAWVEAQALEGCQHCHGTVVQVTQNKQTLMRQISSVGDGLPNVSGQEKRIYTFYIDKAAKKAINWSAVVDFMSAKEIDGLGLIPYDPDAAKSYLEQCYPASPVLNIPPWICSDLHTNKWDYTVRNDCGCISFR